MNTSKLTSIILDAVRSRKDKTNKFTQLAMAINGTYDKAPTDNNESTNGTSDNINTPDQQPTTDVHTFNCANIVNENFTIGTFQLGQTVTVNSSSGKLNFAPYGVLLTQEEYSKIQISVQAKESLLQEQGITQEQAQSVVEDILLSIEYLNNEPSLVIPEGITHYISFYTIYMAIVEELSLDSVTIKYDGIDYVYDSTNVIFQTV